MPTDLSLPLRQAIVAHLRGDASVTALVPANRIFGEWATGEPAWPFIRMGYPDADAFEATGWSGSEHDFQVHVFAEGPGTDAILTIARRIQASMENFAPASMDGAWADFRRQVTIPDVVAGRLHAILTWQIYAVEAV